MFKVIIPVDQKTARIEYFEKPNYVTLQTNGVIISTDDPTIADGVLSEDNAVIYAFKGGKLDTPEYTYEACYMYEVSGNEYIKYTKGNINDIGDQVTESQMAIIDVYEAQNNNATQITETQLAIIDIYEMIAATEDPGTGTPTV